MHFISPSRRHSPKQYLNRRDDTNDAPSADGVSAVSTTALATPVADTSSLLLAASTTSAAANGLEETAATIALTTITATSSASSASHSSGVSSSASATATASGAMSKLSDGAVAGICIGAFAGAIIIIACVVMFLKKWMPEDKGRAGGERQAEPWAKLGDDDDRWDGLGAAPPFKQPVTAMVEKSKVGTVKTATSASSDHVNDFAMFQNNRRSTATHISSLHSEEKSSNFDESTAPNFATYHPDLAKQFAEEGPASPIAPLEPAHIRHPQRPSLGRLETNNGTQLWDAETVVDDSFLSMRSVRMSVNVSPAYRSFGSSSAQRQMSDVTVSSPLHRWEQAEVITPINSVHSASISGLPQSVEHVENPFADSTANTPMTQREQADLARQASRKRSASGSSPFFGYHENQEQFAGANPFADPSVATMPILPSPLPVAAVRTNSFGIAFQQQNDEEEEIAMGARAMARKSSIKTNAGRRIDSVFSDTSEVVPSPASEIYYHPQQTLFEGQHVRMQSLIAALDAPPPEEPQRESGVPSFVSEMYEVSVEGEDESESGEDGDEDADADGETVNQMHSQFPMPPPSPLRAN